MKAKIQTHCPKCLEPIEFLSHTYLINHTIVLNNYRLITCKHCNADIEMIMNTSIKEKK